MTDQKPQKVEDFKHDFGPSFDRAVNAAVDGLDFIRKYTVPKAHVGYAIVRKTSPRGSVSYHAYRADAWERPQQTPLLPWSAPVGEVVAHISMEETIHLTSNPRG